MEEYSNAESSETYCEGQPAKDISQLMQRGCINLHCTLIQHGLELCKAEKSGNKVSGQGRMSVEVGRETGLS